MLEVSCPFHFSVVFVVSMKVVGGSAQFRHCKKSIFLNLGTLFCFLSSEGLRKVLSQPILSDISVQIVTGSSENEADTVLQFCSSRENSHGSSTAGLWTRQLGCMGLAPVKITSLFLR